MSINITELIKVLRNKTGVGILDCKKALSENNYDSEKAIIWLRERGVTVARKKSNRNTSEGVVAVHITDNLATMIEVNVETDFVVRNQRFISLVNTLVKIAHAYQSTDIQQFLQYKHKDLSVNELIAEQVLSIGENINIKRISKVKAGEKGKIVSYVHNKVESCIGRIGVLVAVEGDTNNHVLDFASNVAMHIAAIKPLALDKNSLDTTVLQQEEKILRTQVLQNKKPANIIDKIVAGKLQKFLEENVLLEQSFALDNKHKIKNIISDLKSRYNCEFSITQYVRHEVGE